MCFILALFQVHPNYPLVLAANRDELRTRPSRGPHCWPGEPAILAGRDEVAGGTWLGVNDRGLLAAITNRRDGPLDPSRPSRGNLCLDVLRQPSPEAARALVVDLLAARAYNPFNLLCASPTSGWVATWRGELVPLTPGAYVLTSAGDLDGNDLPKVRRARELLAILDLATPSLDALLQKLGRLCADTTGPDPICRAGGPFGTVSSSLIALGSDGSIAAYWHAAGPPSDDPYVSLDLHEVSPADGTRRSE
jgi:uncharacterized protein with NRDE domain